MNPHAFGIVFDIKRFAIHDGPGIRTTVFLKGCPLDCWWCQNPESRSPDPEPRRHLRPSYQGDLLYRDDDLIGKKVKVADLVKVLEKDVLFFDESGGGVTVSGGEPLLQIDFLQNLLETLKLRDIHTVVDTTGYAGFPLSEGISPVQGMDVNGPTAVIKSAAKIDHLRTGGTLLNQKFTPQVFDTEEGFDKVAKLIRTYFRMDGHHIQFNVVTAETLRKAQKHPEQYRDLIVRVAGYSDYFVDLTPELQEEIIRRTEQVI